MSSKRFLMAIIVAYVVILGSLATLRHLSFHSTAFDLAIYDQTIWEFSKLRMGFNTARGLMPFADHVTPILFLFAPFYWIYSSPITLILLQTIAIALGAFPVYWIAKKKLEDFAGKCLALSYLLYPSLNYIAMFDFHPDALIIPFLLFAFHYFEEKEWKKYFGFLILAGMCKEYVGLIIATIGVYAFFKKERKIAVATAALGIAWLVINLKLITPFYSGQSGYTHLEAYYYLGNSFTGILKTAITNPLFVISNILTMGKILYMLLLLLPVAGTALFAPEILMAAPGLAIMLLQQNTSYSAIVYQHNALIIPFVFIAAVYGTQRLVKLKLKLFNRKTVPAAILLLSIISIAAYGPLTVLYGTETFNVNSRHAKAGEQLIKQIPKEASVSATTYALPHLSHRKEAYMFPNPFYSYGYGVEYWKTEQNKDAKTDYVLLDTSRADILVKNMSYYENFIINNKDYEVVSNNSGWLLLRRK